MNESTKKVLAIVGAIVALAIAAFVGYRAFAPEVPTPGEKSLSEINAEMARTSGEQVAPDQNLKGQ
jgi:hypothetical protein